MRLDRQAEWAQMFDEAWRYERDYFYDPDMHGRDWDAVYARYAPLVPHIRHRADLTYLLDQVNGELSVGHSFVFGGDFPAVDTVRVGLLGADLVPDRGRWRIARIYTSESWNPGLDAPLDRSGLEIEEGHYLLAVNGVEMTSGDDPYRFLDGTAGVQTVLDINDEPTMDGAWRETVEPIESEFGLAPEGVGGGQPPPRGRALRTAGSPTSGCPTRAARASSRSTATTSRSRTSRAPSSTSASTAAASWTTTWWTS